MAERLHCRWLSSDQRARTIMQDTGGKGDTDRHQQRAMSCTTEELFGWQEHRRVDTIHRRMVAQVLPPRPLIR